MTAIPDPGAALEVEILPPDRRLDAAMRESATRPAFDRVLRIAISLRGGVSLAVWMAGALAELDLLRRVRIVRGQDGRLSALVLSPHAAPPSDTTMTRLRQYARAVAAAGYDEVQVDVIAGASAGGLSAVLYAVAQRAGTTLDATLPVWRELAGLQNLLQPPGLTSVEAPLRGDAYFWKTATRAAAELHARGADPAMSHPDLVARRVSVHLSATVINSEAEAEPDVREGRGHFVFRADDRRIAELPNGIPAARERDAEPAEVQLLRLAYASRATSSLPGGFEVARVVSPSGTRRDVLDASEAQAPLAQKAVAESLRDEEERESAFASERLRPDFTFAFSSHRPRRDSPGDAGPYEIIDGGIFDNVPIDRALGVIRATVGETYGDRSLLDLDPEGRAEVARPSPGRPSVSLWKALVAWWQRVQRRESAAEELEEVHRFNGTLMAERGRLEALAVVVADVDVDRGSAEERLRGYLRNLAGTDALFLVDAISRPSRWQLVSLLPRRRKFLAIPAEHLTPLVPALVQAYGETPDPGPLAEKLPSSLIDAAHALLAWVRALESASLGETQIRELRAVRDHVADALAFAQRARDAATFRVLAVTSRAAEQGLDRPLDDQLVASCIAVWLERSRGEEGQARQAREEAALVAHHRRLNEDLARLQTLSPDDDLPADQLGQWRASVWHAVEQRFRGRPLRTLDVVALVAPAGMQPPMSLIATGRISADEQPADPARFLSVRAEERRRFLQEAIDGREADADPGRIAVQSKLAGAGLGNLLGFLSEDWRANDWWWGRLDGAAGILRFLASRYSRDADTTTVEAAVADVQSAIRGEAGTDEAVRGGADTVGNLSPQYRTALATRTLSATLRSAVPGAGATPSGRRSWARGAFRLLEFLLRPLLLLLPTAAAPVRLIVALGAIAGLGWGLTRAIEPDGAGPLSALDAVFAALAAAAAAVLVYLVPRRRVGRWRAISTGSLPRPPGVSAEDSESARRTAARLSNVAGTVAVLAAALLGWSVEDGRLLASAGWLLVTVGAVLWSLRIRTRVPPLQAPLRWAALFVAVPAFAVLAVSGPVLDAIVPEQRETGWLGLVQLVVFAAVFSLVLVWRWETPGKVVAALVAGVVLWLAAWFVLRLVELVPGAFAAPGWILPVAFLVGWANALWALLMLRPARRLPSDSPERTPSPRWFAES